jgi:hypothetical protein
MIHLHQLAGAVARSAPAAARPKHGHPPA